MLLIILCFPNGRFMGFVRGSKTSFRPRSGHSLTSDVLYFFCLYLSGFFPVNYNSLTNFPVPFSPLV